MSKAMNMHEILQLSPVMPVVMIEDAGAAVDMAQALVRGGIRTIEVTLRTPAALRAIEVIARDVPDACVGAGTVLSTNDLESATQAGAAFAISPGTTQALLAAGGAARIPWLPAVATASELMSVLAFGYDCCKFFPASIAGGPAALKAFAGPFPDAKFCPTGGITVRTAPDWLALPNVLCVGGSWLTPGDALARRDWRTIETLAREAAALRRR